MPEEKAALEPVYLSPKDITSQIIDAMAKGQPPLDAEGRLILLAPGIYPDIPAVYYHTHLKDYISSSFIKKFMQYPACALQPTVVTDNMNVGSAIHAYSLEGRDVFNREFAIIPPDALKRPSITQINAKNPSADTLDQIAWWQEFEANCAGKTILPAKWEGLPMAEIIKGADAALKDHPTVKKLLARGMTETTVIWRDKDSGLLCKARVDIYPEEKTFTLVDLKKTADASRDAFLRQICNLNYDVQAGHYSNGVEANGRPVRNFIFIGIEAEHPFPVKTVYLGGGRAGESNPYLRSGEEGNAWLRKAQDEAKRVLMQIAECRELGKFPAYELPQHAVPISQITAEDLLEEAVCPPWRFGFFEAQ